MLTGGPLDVLTGDYLAELTMLILGRDRLKDPSLGYAQTFLKQLETGLGEALDRGVKIVSNAGGLNPAGLAPAIQELADRLGLHPKIAYVEGDDLLAPSHGARPRPAPHRERLPRRVGDRGGTAGRRRRRRHRPGHRRLRDRRTGRRPPRLEAEPVRRTRGRRRRRARDRVRLPGDRRQLRVLQRDPRPRPARVSRSRRSTPTAAASSPSTTAPVARSPSTRSRRNCSTRSPAPGTPVRMSPRGSIPSS